MPEIYYDGQEKKLYIVAEGGAVRILTALAPAYGLPTTEGAAAETPRAITTQKNKGGRPRKVQEPLERTRIGMPRPCCGALGGRHKKGCANAGTYASPTRSKASRKLSDDIGSFHRDRAQKLPLTIEQYSQLRKAMHDRDFQSAEFALTNKLSPAEVNSAVRSSSYEDYLIIR